MIENSSSMGASEVAALNKMFTKNNKAMFIFCACFLAIVLAAMLWLGARPFLVAAATLFGTIALILLLALFQQKTAAENYVRSHSFFGANTFINFRFGEEYIECALVKDGELREQTKFKYSEIYQAVETPGHFFLFQSINSAYVIDKRGFLQGGTEELRQLLWSRLGPARFGDKYKQIKL